MKRYLSLLPAVLLLLTACDPKPDRAAPLPKMVKVAEVVKAGNAQQRVFPARIESGDATDLAFKRAGQIETPGHSPGCRCQTGATARQS